MTCRTCDHFRPQTTATGRIKRAAGRCSYEIEVPALPAVIKRRDVQFLFDVRNRYAAWPDSGEGCPTWKAKA